jgi:hypothetical protein
MMDANHISERLNTIRQEISDLRVTTAQYWSKSQHTVLEKSAMRTLPSLTGAGTEFCFGTYGAISIGRALRAYLAFFGWLWLVCWTFPLCAFDSVLLIAHRLSDHRFPGACG